MSKEKQKGPMSMDMQFARPEKSKSQCPTCVFRKKPTEIKRADGSLFVIEQWDNNECKKYLCKPVGVVFGDVHCTLYEKG